jgi:hypothetical protein
MEAMILIGLVFILHRWATDIDVDTMAVYEIIIRELTNDLGA